MGQADIEDDDISRAEEEALQHQFGSSVLASDTYCQKLLRDATRVRLIPAYPCLTSPSFRSMFSSLLQRLGALIVHTG